MGHQKDRLGTKLLQYRSDVANAAPGYSGFVLGVFSHFDLSSTLAILESRKVADSGKFEGF